MARGQRKFLVLCLVTALVLSACTKQGGDSGTEVNHGSNTEPENREDNGINSKTGSETEMDEDFSEEDVVEITLNGGQITASNTSGVTINGSVATITAAGIYRLTGNLEDGEIRVHVGKKESVRLILDQVSIQHQDGPAIYGMAGKITITLKEGTSNYLSDGTDYKGYEKEENPPTACLYSQDDLKINGGGSLTVQANCNDGITSKDIFKLTGGSLEITSADEGIVGRDGIQILDGALIIHSEGDGLKSSNDETEEKGAIYMEGGNIEIHSAKDGIQAATSLTIAGGDISIVTAGGSANATIKADHMGGFGGRWGGGNASSNTEDTESTKGLKAAGNITITGGMVSADCVDDAIHSNGDVTISGGSLQLATGDDGIHADNITSISGGEIIISNSYEGIEGKKIEIAGGNIWITSSDDGINAADGSATEAGWFGMGGRGPGQASSDVQLTISGGYIHVNASGDGIDSNANINMTGGTCIVDGPTDNNNGAIDYERSFTQTGGFLIAAGASGMAQAMSDGTQCFISMYYNSMQPAGSMICLTDTEDNCIVAYAPSKSYSNVVISSPELEIGKSYRLYIGGKAEGNLQDGLYSDATYTGGALVAEFTISETMNYFTENGQGTGGMGGFGGFGGGRGGNPGGGDPGKRW